MKILLALRQSDKSSSSSGRRELQGRERRLKQQEEAFGGWQGWRRRCGLACKLQRRCTFAISGKQNKWITSLTNFQFAQPGTRPHSSWWVCCGVTAILITLLIMCVTRNTSRRGASCWIFHGREQWEQVAQNQLQHHQGAEWQHEETG